MNKNGNTRLIESCMYLHAIYKIREFFSYKGLNLITAVNFSVHKVHVYFINCFNAEVSQMICIYKYFLFRILKVARNSFQPLYFDGLL